MPNFQRDITLTGGTNDFFVAPDTSTYWLYNPPTNSSVTVSKAGKAPQIISAGEVFVITLAKGDDLAISGTAGNILSIYDHADVKLIPRAAEIIGSVFIVNPSSVKVDPTQNNIISPLTALAGTFTNQVVVALDPAESASQPGTVILGAGTAVAGKVGLSPNLGASDQPDVTVNQGGSLKVTTPVVTSRTLLNFPPTSIATQTETIQGTGLTTLVIGDTVSYNLAASVGPLTTPANDLTYVALKGATTTRYYVTAFLGQTISGVFRANSAEKLNIVVRNQDTVNHSFSGSYGVVV